MLWQFTHPTIAQGFTDHDKISTDPMLRIRLTTGFYFTTTFGSATDAYLWTQRGVRAHRLVKGTTPSGVRYSAAQGELLAWSHACVVKSSVEAWDSFGCGPQLSGQERDQFCREQALAAALLGVPEPPMSYQEVLGCLSQSPLAPVVSDAGTRAARDLLSSPVPTWSLPLFKSLASASISLFPTEFKEPMGLRAPLPPQAARVATAAVRTVRPVLDVKAKAHERWQLHRNRGTSVSTQWWWLTSDAWELGNKYLQTKSGREEDLAKWFLGSDEVRRTLESTSLSDLRRPEFRRLDFDARAAAMVAAARLYGYRPVWQQVRREAFLANVLA